MKKAVVQQLRIISLFLFMLLSTVTFASHIAGGMITYECLGNNQYKVTFKFYRDCTGVSAPNPAQIKIYNSANSLVQTLSLPLISTVPLPTNAPNPCTTPPTGICVEEITYTGNVTLPPIAGGYQLTFDLCCRNPGIVNGPANSSAYSTWIPDVSKATCNNSAVYASAPPMFVCAGLPLSYDHSATDADGDVLTYSLCSAIESAVPLTNYPYSAPYTASNPMGGGLTINPTTGLITGTPNTLGKFVVGVCVTESRNGVVINTTTRDFQWNVVDCHTVTVASALSALTDCNTHKVSFFNNSTGGVSYLWSFGDGQTTTAVAPTHNYSSLGTYNVTLISFATNPACNDTLTSLVALVDTCRPCGMTVNISTVDGVCGPTASGCYRVKYEEPCVGSGTGYTYGGSGTVNCGSSTQISGGTLPATPYSFTMNGTPLPTGTTVVSQTPITGACNKYIYIRTVGGVTIIEFNAFLNSPQTGGATANITGGTPPYTINWTTTPTQSGTSATGVSPGTYSCIVTDAQGCTETKTFTISGNSTLNFTASETDATGCGLNDGTLSVSGVTGSTGTVTYSWSPGGWTTATVNNVPPGTYLLTINDGANCPKDTTITVGGVPSINVTATITNLTCAYDLNGGATASATGGAGPYTYTWNTSPVQTGATVTGLSKGFYTVTGTDANGCKGTFSFSISAPNPLVLTMSKVNPLCSQGTTGTATVSASGGTGALTYLWSTNAANQNTVTATNLKGNQTYTVTVTDANGCTATGSVSLTDPAQINHDVLDKSTIDCSGTFVGAAEIVASGGTGSLSYAWTCTSAVTAIVNNLPVGTCTVVTTDGNGCTAQDTITIINPGVMSITASSTPSCGSSTDGTATVKPIGGATPYYYLWNTGGATTQSISGLSPGSTYTITVTDKSGCTATSSVTIGNSGAVSLSSVVTPGCNNNSAIDLSVSGGTPGYIYTWSSGQNTQDISGLAGNVYYKVTVWDANNCFGSLTTFISKNGCNPTVIIIPNVFTPNGDGNNDIFYFYTEGVKELTCTIYDRWGLKMHEWSTVSGGWDGKAKNGKPAPDGVYYFIMTATPENTDEDIIRKEGFLQLLKEK